MLDFDRELPPVAVGLFGIAGRLQQQSQRGPELRGRSDI